jgi:peptidoglycan/xylan/chitin deacetylase (PgdA/CDA1 family)
MRQIYDMVARIAWGVGLTSTLNRAARYVRAVDRCFRHLRESATETYQVLMYHRVNADADPFSVHAVHPADFEQQIIFLKQHYSVLPLEELWRRARERSLPPNAVAITFDDGYADNHQFAFPILRKHQVPATLFLATSVAERHEPLWYDQVLHGFRSTARARLDFPALGLATARLATVEERRSAASRCLAGLRRLPDVERRRCQDDLLTALGVRDFDDLRGLMMGWDEARALDRGGFSVQAHTASHPIMSRLPAEAAREEVLGSKRAIEAALQKDVSFFAYPNGKLEDFTDETKAVLRAAGFQAAFSTMPFKNAVGDDPYALGRATPWLNDVASFALQQARINLAR